MPNLIFGHQYNPNADGYCMYRYVSTNKLCEASADLHHLVRPGDRKRFSLKPSTIENKPAPRRESHVSKCYVKRHSDGYEIGPYDYLGDARVTVLALRDLTGDLGWHAYRRTEIEETIDL